MKYLSLVIIVSLLAASPVFAQEVNQTQLRQLVKVEPVTAKSAGASARPAHLLPPQGQPADTNASKASGTSHKKRNIIIAVVVAAAVGGVIVAAHNGAYGSSGSGY